MEKYKHAPGPWTAEPSLATMPFVIRDARGWSVAYVTGVADTGTAPENARLIKEAPALLEALTNLCLAVLTVRVSGPKDVPELVEPHEWAMHVLAQVRGLVEAGPDLNYEWALAEIRARRAHAHALWVLLGDEHERDGYALRPFKWEGPGEYQSVTHVDGRRGLVRLPSWRGLPIGTPALDDTLREVVPGVHAKRETDFGSTP